MEFAVLYAIQKMSSPAADRIMTFLSSLGSCGFIWILLAAGLLIFGKTRKCGAAVALALIMSLILCNIMLKNVVCRPRPCWIDETVKLLIAVPKDYSFPSGHTFASFAAAAGVFCFHKKWGAAALALAAAIGFSRLYLFVHFPSDVIAGAVMGTATGVAACRIVRYVEEKFCKKGFERGG